MLEFGRFRIASKPFRLWDGDQQVALTRRQKQLLCALLDSRGQTLSKHRLMESIWGKSIVEDANLTQTVFSTRRLLGRFPDGSHYIETVSGEGYRLNEQNFRQSAPLERDADERPDGVQAPSAPEDKVLFRLLVDSIEDYSIFFLDCAGYIRTWNRGAERNTGYASADILNQHFSLLFTPEDIEARLPEREMASATFQGRYQGEGWRARKSGERFWASVVLTPVRNENKMLIGFGKVVRDLTETKRQAEALLRMEVLARHDRDRFRAAVESSMDAFFTCEAVRDQSGEIEDFVYTYANANVADLVSLPSASLLGGRMCELFPINKEAGLFRAYCEVVRTGKPFLTKLALRERHVNSSAIRLQAVKLADGIAVTVSDLSGAPSA